MKFEVGSKLWYVPDYGRRDHLQGQEVTVTKIGKSWVYFGERMRFDLECEEVDGGEYSSPGKIYQNEEAYIQAVTLTKVWDAFRQILIDTRRCPDDLSEADVRAAAALLKVEIP